MHCKTLKPNLNQWHEIYTTIMYAKVGQFVDYGVAMRMQEPDRVLYLAVPQIIYDSLFQKRVIQATLDHINCKLIVYNPQNNTIVSWIK